MYVIDPGRYRELEEIIKSATKGKGIMEVVNLKEVTDGEEAVE